jgi:hypothetical protein
MAKLSYHARKHMPKSEFAEPGRKAYPIEDAAHARNALARVSQHGSESEKKEVRAAVHRKFPQIGEGRNKAAKRVVHRRSHSRA